MRKNTPLVRLLLALLLAVAGSAAALVFAAAPPGKGGTVTEKPAPAPTWKEVDALVEQQKFEEARKKLSALREKARAAGDEEGWTKALVREVQLETALHGYETSVRFLREEPWPKGPVFRSVLDLSYGNALVTYSRAYGWEIGRREKVESKGVDLKAWTREQIFEEALKAYLEAWKVRDGLGSEPVSRVSAFVDANDYPAEVRGTLRDVVSYFLVDLLGNTSGWTPEESNALFTLDVAALVAGDPGVSRLARLDDPAVHPVVKIGAVLDDLEAWHAAAGRREAALEARLERSRRLFSAFTEADDRDRIASSLRKRLEKERDLSWWSEGMFQLASFVRQEERPGKLARARATAAEGEKAYPGSVGGKRCAAFVRGLEAPSFSLQSMSADGTGKRSVLVVHRNLPELFFRSYAVDLDGWLASARDYNLLPSGDEVKRLLAGKAPEAEWRVPLPATPDLEEHRTFATPPLAAPGLKLVVASVRKGFGTEGNQVLAANLLLTDLVLVSRGDGSGGLEVRALAGSTGAPRPGTRVTLWQRDWQKGHQKLETKETDPSGSVLFPSRDSGNFFVTARRGGEVALDAQYLSLFRPTSPERTVGTLVYTDRAIYRPGQKILWKVLLYRSQQPAGTKFTAASNEATTISLHDANGEKVDEKSVSTNGFGSAAGEFAVPSGRLLGAWALRASTNGSASVRVEEYKRPTFEASFRDGKEPMRLNRPALVVGEAKYYFGLPVASGKVSWRVTREPVWPWWWGAWGWGGGASKVQTIATGSTSLKEDGTFEVRFTPAADERQAKKGDGVSWRYAVSADVTDEGGETRSAERRVRLGFTSVEARIEWDEGFFLEGTPAAATLRRTDLDGVPRPGKGTWRVLRLKQPATAPLPADLPRQGGPAGSGDGEEDSTAALLTEGDRQRARWETQWTAAAVLHDWPDGAEVARGEADHGARGEAKAPLGSLAAGAYRLRYRTVDDFGKTAEASRDFVVGGKRTPLALPLVLLGPSHAVKVGETARFLVTSGIPGQEVTLDLYSEGRLLKRNVLVGGSDPSLLEIPVTERERGGFSLQATAVRDHQFLTASASVSVPWDDRELKVEFATFRDRMAPGGKESWRITVHGPGGKAEAGTAEVLATMYDRSLDVFAPFSLPSPLSLLPIRTAAPLSRASLGTSGGIWIFSNLPSPPSVPQLSGDRLKGFDSWGIGGPGGRSYPRSAAGRGGVLPPMAMAMAPPPAPAPAPAAQAMKSEAKAKNAPAEAERADAAAPLQKEASAAAPAPLRSNFAETAFWRPQLLTNADGSVTIEFTVPDSVTSWNVWTQAVTNDLRAGTLKKETKSVKELMVRPYLPRFLREGDVAELKVVVNDAGEKPLDGVVAIDILDADTNASLLSDFGIDPAGARKAFSVKPGGGTNVVFPLKAPRGVRTVAFKVTATADGVGDGELRPLPVLPSRMHLVQSRFVTLKEGSKKTMRFEDLARADDPTLENEQLVVTVDAQLFYSVLSALPYLVNYPYECTEQTLNRFVSTGIVSSLYEKYPAVAAMAKEFARRETPLETWDATDPNRKMALEESPWLDLSRGGKDAGHGLVNVLDPRAARAEREASLVKLRKAQTASGGFPWWPGGPPSPWMTVYLMHGFAKAAEFGVDVPKDVVQKGWQYVAKHYRDDLRRCMKRGGCFETLTFLNYVASCYPDASWTGDALTEAERKEILAFSFSHWKEHSPYLKGYLALTLKRAGRAADAKLVWDSVMDSAKTTEDQGTSWTREDRSWLWYNDTVETQAFALRTLAEMNPKDPRREGLVQWLLLDKKMGHWKSTRATAEAIYALVHYLKQEGALSVREEVRVVVGPRTATFTFEPDVYSGKGNRLVVPGPQVDPKSSSTVTVEKSGKGFAFASATWSFSTERLPDADRGDFFNVSRRYFLRAPSASGFTLKPIGEGAVLRPGDQVEVQLSLRTKHEAEYVHLRDPRAAGLEPESPVSRYRWDLGIGFYEEVRDSGANFFLERLPAGEYTFKYRLRVNMAGTFRVGPATVQSMYAPEFAAYSSGAVLTVKGE